MVLNKHQQNDIMSEFSFYLCVATFFVCSFRAYRVARKTHQKFFNNQNESCKCELMVHFIKYVWFVWNVIFYVRPLRYLIRESKHDVVAQSPARRLCRLLVLLIGDRWDWWLLPIALSCSVSPIYASPSLSQRLHEIRSAMLVNESMYWQ